MDVTRGRGLGRIVFGLGVMALGAVCLAFGKFDSGQPVPKDFPLYAPLAYAAGAFLIAAGAGLLWRKTAAWAAAALAFYFALIVVVLMDGHAILAHSGAYRAYGSYSGTAEELAIAAGALIVFAGRATIDPSRAAALVRAARVVFGICAMLFGGAHFAYMSLTAPLVPSWLPPSQLFWGYATGVAHIAAGLAIIVGVRARLAAILLTLMYASFTPLVHVPMLMAHPGVFFEWTENALNIVLTGVAWVVADSLAVGSVLRPTVPKI